MYTKICLAFNRLAIAVIIHSQRNKAILFSPGQVALTKLAITRLKVFYCRGKREGPGGTREGKLRFLRG